MLMFFEITSGTWGFVEPIPTLPFVLQTFAPLIVQAGEIHAALPEASDCKSFPLPPPNAS